MQVSTLSLLKILPIFPCLLAANGHAATASAAPATSAVTKFKENVDNLIKPLMQKNAIPGMAVAVSINGKNYFYNYGVASKKTQQAVSKATLFEIGSLSKTLSATLATYAQEYGQLSLNDKVSQHLPDLRGTSFDNISLINLGTHTAGDFPLQIPDEILTNDQLMDYYKNWKPTQAAGSARTYSNPGVGLLSIVTAKSMGMPFAEAMEKKLFAQLGLKHSYIHVPKHQMKNYAQGYNKNEAPVRVKPEVLADEAYGVKTTSADMIRFIDANMGLIKLDDKLQRAITATHTGYFTAGEITQDLIWEQYPDTAALERLVVGNSPQMILETTPANKLNPPLPPQIKVFINKTGSTGGFGAYALYSPAKKIGIVMLANRSYPNAERVTVAYTILKQLESGGAVD